MKSNSLFKHQSLVAIVLCSSIGIASQAIAQETGVSRSATPKNLMSATSGGKSAVDFSSLFGQANSDPCSNQYQRIDTLASSAQQAQMESFNQQEQSATSQLEANQNAEKAVVNQANALDAYQAKTRAIAAKLDLTKLSLQSKAAKQIREIRNQMIEQDTKINEAKAALRASASAIAKAETDKEAQCRAIADSAGTALKTKIDAKYDALKQKMINYGSDSLAGTKNRREQRRLIDIQNEYMTSYKNCLSGSSAQGAAVAKNVTDAQRDYKDAEQSYNDVLAVIAKQAQTLKDDLAQIEKDGQNELTAAQIQVAQELDQAFVEYKATLSQLQLEAKQSGEKAGLMQKFAVARGGFTAQSLQAANIKLQQATYNADMCSAKNAGSAKLAADMQQICNSTDVKTLARCPTLLTQDTKKTTAPAPAESVN